MSTRESDILKRRAQAREEMPPERDFPDADAEAIANALRALASGASLGLSVPAIGAARGLARGDVRGGIREEAQSMRDMPQGARALGEFTGAAGSPIGLLGRAHKLVPGMYKVGSKVVKGAARVPSMARKLLSPLRGSTAAGAAAGATSGAVQELANPEDTGATGRGALAGAVYGALPDVAQGAIKAGRFATGPMRVAARRLKGLPRPSRKTAEAVGEGAEKVRRGVGMIAGRAASESSTPPAAESADAETERKARRLVNQALMQGDAQQAMQRLDSLLAADKDTALYKAAVRRLKPYMDE